MTTSYNDIINTAATEKITLVHVEPTQRFLIWSAHSGSVYKRTVTNFIVNISEDESSLTQGSSASLSSGEWWFDAAENIVYIRTSDDSNPNSKDIVGTYRLFYSDAPLNLPCDLASGVDVEYQGRLKTSSAITKQLDDERVGIALESSTTISLHNEDGYFDTFFDKYFFENKTVQIYSWSPLIPLSEKQLLFKGIVQEKYFSGKEVKFKAKDYIYRLRERVQLPTFSESDGSVAEAHIGTPKRRLYGQFDNLQCVGIDNVLDGYNLTGTLAGNVGEFTLSGSGTSFLDECSPGDTVFLSTSLETYELDIDVVDSDTQLTLSEEIPVPINGQVRILPERPWRKKNRKWLIAGHKLRAPSTTVTAGYQPNRFTVDDETDFFSGDLVSIDGEDGYIKRISGDYVVMSSNLQGGTPSASDTVTKSPVSKAYINKNEAFISRDWTVTNTTQAILVLDNLAEFNIARPKNVAGSFTFTNGSREISITGINLTSYIKTRDWIRSSDVTHTTWYEVLSVSEASVTVRTPYGGGTLTDSAQVKTPDLVEDGSIVTVNCLGMESDGVWIKTAAQAISDLIVSDAGVANVDSAEFTQASIDGPQVLSLAIPEVITGDSPMIRDVISKINESVFGSLINNSEWEIVFKVLSPDRPVDILEVKDDDVLDSMSVVSKNEIVKAVNLKYRPFLDRFTGENVFTIKREESDFVSKYIGQDDELDIVCYLYNEDDATEIAQRYLLYKSLSTSTIKISTKLQFILKNLTDAVMLNLDRLYERFGNSDRRKIGSITKISKSGGSTMVEVNDLGGMYNRVMSISDDSGNDFASSGAEELVKNAYICDDNLNIPTTSNDAELGRNLIG
jgi:hypothetical protein